MNLSQSLSRSYTRSPNQSLSRPLSRSMSRSPSESLSRSMSRSMSRPLSRSTSQSMSRPLSRSTSQSMSRPLSQSMNRPLSRSTSQSMSRPLSQSMNRPLSRSMSRPLSRSMSRPLSRSMSRPLSRSMSRPLSQSMSRPLSRSMSRPLSRSMSRPLSRSMSRPLSRSMSRPLSRSMSRPLSRSMSRPLSRSMSRPLSRSMSRPLSRSMSRPLSRSMSRPLSQSLSRSFEKSDRNHYSSDDDSSSGGQEKKDEYSIGSQIVSPNGVVYIIISKLGSGTYGLVFKVKNRSGKIYALKVMNGSKIRPDIFNREVNALKKFGDKYCTVISCVRAYWYDPDRNVYILVIDYIDGVTMDRLNLPVREDTIGTWKKILLMLVMSLRLIHSFGMMHLDIKPENLMVTRDFHIYFVDFGLACIKPPCHYGGTPDFMGIEILEGVYNRKTDTSDISQLSDVYSLGVTMYELISKNYYLDEDIPNDRILLRHHKNAHRKLMTWSKTPLAQSIYPWNIIITQMTNPNRFKRPRADIIIKEYFNAQKGMENPFYSDKKIMMWNYKYV